MKRIVPGFIYLLMLCLPFSSYAAFKPVDLNPRIKSGQLVQVTDNFVVIFDKSASMGELHGKPMVNEATRLNQGKDAVRNMIATMPATKLYAGLRTFWGEKAPLIYGVNSLDKKKYTKAINSIENPNHRSNMGKAILTAGMDLKWGKANSALIIVSDFADNPGIDDIRPTSVLGAISKVNADLGDKLCVYAIQVGYSTAGKELSEQIVQNVKGGYTVNADKLMTPAAMGAFVEKVISGKCSRYPELAAKPQEKIFVVVTEPMVEEQVEAAVSEANTQEKVVILAFEDINFDFEKSTLTPGAQRILKRNIQMLKDKPKTKVRIAVYTSASGTPDHKRKLGESRANAVQEYLISEDLITRDRLYTIAYGETNPTMYEAAPKEIYSKATKTNTRVLFEIIVQ